MQLPACMTLGIISLALLGCVSQTSNTNTLNAVSSKEVSRTDIKTTSKTLLDEALGKKYSLKKSKGVISYTEGDVSTKKDKFVKIFDQDGSLWHQFTFYYDDSDGKFEYENENFKPFSFHPDNFVLALKCVGETEEFYKIVANEEKELVKFVKKDDPLLKFETWEKHILSLNAISFDLKENPLRKSPDGKPLSAKIPEDSTFTPEKIEGDWLNIKNSSGLSGWIKWKDKDTLLIEMFYTS